jgi:hypothetical protein
MNIDVAAPDTGDASSERVREYNTWWNEHRQYTASRPERSAERAAARQPSGVGAASTAGAM